MYITKINSTYCIFRTIRRTFSHPKSVWKCLCVLHSECCRSPAHPPAPTPWPFSASLSPVFGLHASCFRPIPGRGGIAAAAYCHHHRSAAVAIDSGGNPWGQTEQGENRICGGRKECTWGPKTGRGEAKKGDAEAAMGSSDRRRRWAAAIPATRNS